MYLVKAQKFLAALLSADHYLPEATDGWQSILRRATSRWSDPETGAVFGDYFLLEAMVSHKSFMVHSKVMGGCTGIVWCIFGILATVNNSGVDGLGSIYVSFTFSNILILLSMSY